MKRMLADAIRLRGQPGMIVSDNKKKPHTSLGGLAPAVCAKLNGATRPALHQLPKGSARAGP